jgi:hypothetical protein
LRKSSEEKCVGDSGGDLRRSAFDNVACGPDKRDSGPVEVGQWAPRTHLAAAAVHLPPVGARVRQELAAPETINAALGLGYAESIAITDSWANRTRPRNMNSRTRPGALEFGPAIMHTGPTSSRQVRVARRVDVRGTR